MSDAKAIGSVEELGGLIELSDVAFLKVNGWLLEEPGEENSDEPEIRMFPYLGDDGLSLVVRVQTELHLEKAHIEVEVAVKYVLEEAIEPIGEGLMGEFLGRSAILTAGPYLREAIHTTGSRLRVEVPLMPLFKPTRLRPQTFGEDGDQKIGTA